MYYTELLEALKPVVIEPPKTEHIELRLENADSLFGALFIEAKKCADEDDDTEEDDDESDDEDDDTEDDDEEDD